MNAVAGAARLERTRKRRAAMGPGACERSDLNRAESSDSQASHVDGVAVSVNEAARLTCII
jgi:hypothetical protein